MPGIPTKKPTRKQIDGRALALAVAGKEKEYPVYRFSKGEYKYERPKHNPFEGL